MTVGPLAGAWSAYQGAPPLKKMNIWLWETATLVPVVAAPISNSRTTDPIPGSLVYVVNLSAQYEMNGSNVRHRHAEC